MREFIKGDVVKLFDGYLVIVQNYRKVVSCNGDYDVIDWISYYNKNSSGCTRVNTYESKEMCWDCDINDGGYIDEECKTCKGTGQYIKKWYGMDKAEIIPIF